MSKVYTEQKIIVGEEGERWHYEIFPDADTGGGVEIRSVDWDRDDKTIRNMVFTPEMARHVAAAFIKMADHLDKK